MSQKKGLSLFSITILVGLMIGSALFGVTPAAYAADGSGTNTVSPTSTDYASTGNTFTFTFTAAETMDSGGINIGIPTGFSAPQGTAGTAGYTTVSTTGVIATVKDTANSATGWSAGTACSSGAPTADAVVFHEGTASIRCTNGNESNNDQWYKNVASQNWSSYTVVGFWIRTTGALASGDLEFVYDDTANVGSELEALALPAVSANTWTYVTLSFGATTRTAIVSYGFRAGGASAIDSKTIYIDDILLGPGSLTFPSSSIDARLLQLASSGTVTVTYGAGGGASGVTTPSANGTYTATTTSRFDDSGTLTNIASHPTITVRNPVPVLTSISPTSTEINSGTTTITLTGSNFISSSVARWNGSDRTTTFSSSTQLLMTVPSSDLTTAGTSTITVFNPTPGGGTSSGQSFVVRNRVPVVISLSPNEAFIGDATTTVTVAGQNFVSGATANWNGSARTTVFVNSTTLDMTVTATDLATAGTSTVTATNPTPGGGTSTTSAAFVVKYRTPTITSNTPDPVFVNETTVLTITGTNFYSASVVKFAGTTLSSTTTGSTVITATLPAATASTTGAFSLTVTSPTPGGGTAATTTNVHYRTPTLDSIVPSTAIAGASGATSTVTGTGFAPATAINWNGSARTTVFASSTQVSVFFTTADFSTATTASITATNPTPGGGTSNALTFTVLNPSPTTSSISPTSTFIGDATTTITIVGTGFNAQSIARYNGSNRTTTFISATSVQMTLPPSDMETATDTALITVFNSTPGGGTSNAQTFSVRYRTPTITSNTPDPVFVNEAAVLTITGTNFYSTSVVKFAGTTLSSTTTGSTSITATLPAATASTTGAFSLTVTSPTPGGGTAATTTNVHYRTPTLDSISPTSTDVGSDATLITLTGTNFYAASVARFDGTDISTSYVSSTTLTATIPASMLTTAGTSTVTVFTPTPGGGTSGGQSFVKRNGIPVVTSVSPNEAFEDDPDTAITVSGSRFASGVVIRFDGSDLATVYVSSTTTTATIPAASLLTGGGTSTITAFNPTPGGGVSTTSVGFLIKHRAPTLTSIAPTEAFVGDATTTITLTGTFFHTDSVVRFDATDLVTTYISSTTLTANIPTALLTTAGTSTVTVFTHTPGGGVSGGQTFLVKYRTPILTSIAPTEANVGSGDTLITLTGSNFYAASVARFDGTDLSTSYVSSTTLTATIPASMLTTVGTSTVTVFNPTPGGGTSGGQTFLRRNPTPSVTSSSPSEAFVNDPDTSITVTGTGFVSTTIVRFDGNDLATTFVNNTTATATIPTAYLGTVGTSTITAFNSAPGGGVSTTSVAFLVKNRVPVITALSPNNTEEGSATTSLTISGTFFANNATATFDGTPLSIDSQSSTTVNTNIPASLLTTFGTSTVAVTNPTPGGGTATSSFIITRSAVRFVIIDPTDGTVDAPITVTVVAQKENGATSTNYQSDVTLNTTGSATPTSVLINIVNGIGTANISDTVAETVSLSLTDSQATGLDVSSTQQVVFAHGAIAKFTLMGPATLDAGNRAAFTATRRDQFNNPATTGPNTTAYFYTTSTSTSAKFYDAATDGSIVTSALIASGTSTATVWYYDEEPGTYTITVSDNGTAPDGAVGIDDATSTIMVQAVATRFVIINPADGTVDAPITVTVQAQDNLGHIDANYQSDVSLIASSTSGQATTTGNGVVDIINGVGTINVSDTVAETAFLSLSDTQGTGLNVASSTQDVIFAPGVVAQFSLSHSGDMEQNTRKEFIAGRKDQYGNFVSASTTVGYLYASPTSTIKFYDAASGGSEITSVTLTPGNATTSFWFYSNAPATTTVTVSDNVTAPDGDTGINDASNDILVTPIAVRFEIVNPTDGTVDASIAVTVRALDQFGQVVTSFNQDVTIVVTGSAVANPALVDIISGVGTTQVSDTVAQTVNLSLTDSQSTGLAATSTQDVVFGVGAFAKLNLNNVTSATAGTLVPYTVTRTDQYDNQITSGSYTVNLSATPTTTPGLFYAGNSTTSAEITSVAITSGNASAQFWYYNETAGSYQVTAQTGAVIGYDDIVIDPSTITKFTINDRTSMNPASRVQYTVTRKDQFNNLVTAGSVTAYLYASPTGSSTAFYDAATAGSIITSVTIGTGQSAQSAWYYEEVAGTHTITASDNATAADGATGILDASDNISVQTATGTRFVFSPAPAPQTVSAGASSVVTIQAQDDYGNVDSNYQSDVTLVTGVNSASGAGMSAGQALIDIVNGEGTITLTDTVAETVNLALSDSQSTGLNVSAVSSINWTAGAVSQFTLSDQTSMVAGSSTSYVVTRKDQYGNAVTSGSNIVYLYSNSTGAQKRFQASETSTTSISFVTLSGSMASTTFWYHDETAGTWDITASDNATAADGATGIADASDSLIVTPAPVVADRYVILDPADAGLNENTVVIIQARDASGALDTTVQEDVYLVFSTSSIQSSPMKLDGRALVSIVDGIGTVTVSDAIAETVQLSLQRLTGSTSTLAITSTQDVMFFVRQTFIGGGTGVAYVPPTASFTGRAYPGARVSLFARIGGQDIPLERDIEVRADGTFTIDFSGALKGLESFGLAIYDKDGKVAQIKTYDMNKVTKTTEQKNLYIAPTTGLVQRTVTVGNNVGVTGSAAPGSVIKAEVDGKPVEAQAQVGRDGTYRLLINTRELSYGGHVVRTKQIDKNGVESDYSTLKVFTVSRTLVTRADLNNNGGVDIGDWSIFLTRFGSTDPEARRQVDLNDDGKVDISDFSIFIRSTVNR